MRMSVMPLRRNVYNAAGMPNISYWIRRPHLIVPRVRYWVWERANADKPWICRGAIEFLDRVLSGQMRGLEFGSGRSTAWFAKRLRSLVSVEHDAAWHRSVSDKLRSAGLNNVDYRLIPLDHAADTPEQSTYSPRPRYVAVAEEFAEGSLDLVVVDGHYRTHCIAAAVPKLARGGYLVIDDLNLWPTSQALGIPGEFELLNESTNGLKRTGIWRRRTA
jgi:hypothetical protein